VIFGWETLGFLRVKTTAGGLMEAPFFAHISAAGSANQVVQLSSFGQW